MAQEGGFTIRDYNGETSRTQIRTDNVTALNAGDILTQWGALRTAIDNITLGVLAKESLSFFNANLSNARATDPNAQVERKWQVFYEGVTAELAVGIPNPFYRQPFTVEIGTADLANGNLLANSDEADLTDTQMAAFVTAFETIQKDPANGDVEVLKIVAIGSRR